jgi:hypothetical protein
MKKLLSVLLLILFALSIYFTISNDIINNSASNDSAGYASIIPIPPPEPPARRGC